MKVYLMKTNAVRGQDVIVDGLRDLAMEWAECPHCKGIFGVDVTYLEQVDDVVHCPMCCEEVRFLGWD